MDPRLCFKAALDVADAGSFSETARRIDVAIAVVKTRIDRLGDEYSAM